MVKSQWLYENVYMRDNANALAWTDGGGRIAIWSWWWNEMSLEAMQDEPDFGVWQRLWEIEKKNMV